MSIGQMDFAPGNLVRVRNRDWVVLPSLEPDVLHLRPLTGGDDEAIGLFLPLERREIRETSFAWPDPKLAGDTTGGLLLRDAARLSLRAGAAPFRSLGRISVVPRPQLVRAAADGATPGNRSLADRRRQGGVSRGKHCFAR